MDDNNNITELYKTKNENTFRSLKISHSDFNVFIRYYYY